MSAQTLTAGAVQLAEYRGLAPFPVLTSVRQRSSSLNAPVDDVRIIDGLLDCRNVDGMLWGRSRKDSAADGQRGAAAAMLGNKQKVTAEGRERRLSTAGAGGGVAKHLHLRASNPGSTPTAIAAVPAQQVQPILASTSRNVVLEKDAPTSPSISPMVVDGQDVRLTQLHQQPDSTSEFEVSEQRARAYAALTGSRPSPNPSTCRAAGSTMLAGLASASQPALVPISASAHSQLRRRTTSSNDAPTMADRNRIPPTAASKTARRTRVQSANVSTAHALAGQSSIPGPTANTAAAAVRRKRRSLSQENSLVATRLARAFLARELGDSAINRRPANAPRESWSTDESEQKELWLALQDGVLLCRLLNHLVPNAISYIDRRDVSSAKTANISNFVAASKTHLPLQPHEFFEVDQLYSGSPSGFERVLHTICAIAEYTTLRQHAALSASSGYEASRSTDSLLASPLSRMGSPPPSPSPLGYSPTPALPSMPGQKSPGEASFSRQRATSPMSGSEDERPASASSLLSSSISRPSRLSSSNGIRIRSRTGSHPSESLINPSSISTPSTSAAIERKTQSVTFAASTSDNPTRKAHHAVYGSTSDKRMSESAVEIMSVVREGEEMPMPRRAASDRPVSLDARLSESECTPVKRMLDRSVISDSDMNSSSENLPTPGSSESGLPLSTRASRLRQSGSGGGAEIIGLRGSPRLVRKRLSSSTDQSSTPVRASSTSPTHSVMSDGGRSTPTNFPFPRAPSLIRAKSVAGHTRKSSIPQLNIDEGLAEEEPQTAQNPTALVRPRQHKRWNSEVYEQPLNGSRVRQDPPALRSRHDSFMPFPHRAEMDSPSNRASPSPMRDLRRRSMDRAQSMEASRQQLIVREPGKVPITYQLGECIGRGQFGSVYRALNIHTGSVVAVKRIGLSGKSEEEITELQREVDLLKSLSHPSVVKYEGLVRTEHFVNIVLEYVENGSLQHTLNAFGILPEALAASYVVKILEGLSYLHSVQVIHRDLKAANILTTKKGNIKLSDFGVSLQLNAVHSTLQDADATGTPNWMAPEVIKLEKATCASDIWSLGCCCVELITGKPPYANLLAMTAMFKIVEDDMPPLPPNCSPELEDFLTLCFAKEPEDRPTADMLFEHSWLRKHWHNHKQTLRPQDSIPFFRRISSEYHRRPDFVREGSASSDVPELDRSISSPGNSSLMHDEPNSPRFHARDPVLIVQHEEQASRSVGSLPIPDMDVITSELLRSGKDIATPGELAFSVPNAYPFPRTIHTQVQSPVLGDSGPAHSFVKTTFSKPIECKLCHQHVRKYAVLCEECGLICHAKCKEFAPVPCDLRSQLLGLSTPLQKATTPLSIPSSITSPMLSCSVPLVEPSPLTSPSQYAFHSKFGIGQFRKPKGSPQSDPDNSPVPGDSPGRGKAVNLLRRTSSPDRFGLPVRPRPASYASSSSLTRSREANASSSSSSDSHPLSAASIPEDNVIHTPVAINKPAMLSRRSFSGGKPKPAKVKHGKKESSGDCIIS